MNNRRELVEDLIFAFFVPAILFSIALAIDAFRFFVLHYEPDLELWTMAPIVFPAIFVLVLVGRRQERKARRTRETRP